MAESYNRIAIDDTEAVGAIFQYYKDNTDAELFEAMLGNTQLQYLVHPILHESSKRIPEMTYAQNLSTTVEDMLCIMNKLGVCATSKLAYTSQSDVRKQIRRFFSVTKNGKDVALMLVDDVKTLRGACGGIRSGLCDMQTLEWSPSMPKGSGSIATVIDMVPNDSESSSARIVSLAKALNLEVNAHDLQSLQSYPYRIPKNSTELKGVSYRHAECFVVGTSNIITLAKCMLEDVPCVLVPCAQHDSPQQEMTMYKPPSSMLRDIDDLHVFINTVQKFVKSEKAMQSAQDNLLRELDACCNDIVKQHKKMNGKDHRVEMLILVDALQAIRTKLNFIFETLDVNDILTAYLPLEDDTTKDKTNLDTLQGFNNTNVRFLRDLIDALATAETRTTEAPFDKGTSDQLQENFAVNILANQEQEPKHLVCSVDSKAETRKGFIPSSLLERADKFFDLFGMSMCAFEKKFPGRVAAHTYHKLILTLIHELDKADNKITDLEIFDGQYKANHGDYFVIWNDLDDFVAKTPLNDVSCESAMRQRPAPTKRGLKVAYEISNRYRVVATSTYLHEISSIIENVADSPRLLDALKWELDHANDAFEAADRDAYLNETFRANALVEGAVESLVSRLEEGLIVHVGDLWKALEFLQTFRDDDHKHGKKRRASNATAQHMLLCDTLLRGEGKQKGACIALHRFLQHDSHCLDDFQDRIEALVSFQELLSSAAPLPQQHGGGANTTTKLPHDIQAKLRTYVVKLMNSKTDVILQCTLVVFMYVISNGIYRYYEKGAPTSTKELMKQIVMNTVLMAALANVLTSHTEVELCIYAMYFAYVGMAVLRLVKTS